MENHEDPAKQGGTVTDALQEASLSVLLQDRYEKSDLEMIGHHLLPDDLKSTPVVPFYIVMARAGAGSDVHYWTIKPMLVEDEEDGAKFTSLCHDGMFGDGAWHQLNDVAGNNPQYGTRVKYYEMYSTALAGWRVHSIVFMPVKVCCC